MYLSNDAPPIIRLDGGNVVLWGGVRVAAKSERALEDAVGHHHVLDGHVHHSAGLEVAGQGADDQVTRQKVVIDLLAFDPGHTLKTKTMSFKTKKSSKMNS